MDGARWPKWVGGAGMVWGIIGVLGAVQSFLLSPMIEAQQSALVKVHRSLERRILGGDSGSEAGKEDGGPSFDERQRLKQGMKLIREFGPVPPWIHIWMPGLGLLGLLVAALYIYGSMLLLRREYQSIFFFYFAAGAGAVLGLLRAMIAALSFSFLGLGLSMQGLFATTANLLFLYIVTNSDKRKLTR